MPELFLSDADFKKFHIFLEEAYATGREMRKKAESLEIDDPTLILIKNNILNTAWYLEKTSMEILRLMFKAKLEKPRKDRSTTH